jgi:hypothetical protein
MHAGELEAERNDRDHHHDAQAVRGSNTVYSGVPITLHTPAASSANRKVWRKGRRDRMG